MYNHYCNVVNPVTVTSLYEEAPLVIDEGKKLEWLNSMPTPEAVVTAEFMLQNLNYISHEVFLERLRESAEGLIESINDRPYVVLLPRDHKEGVKQKSESWVAQLAEKYESRKPVTYLHMQDAGSYMKEHPEITDFVLFDDASYSGTRIQDSILDLNDAAVDWGRKVTVHALPVFATNYALEKIASTSECDHVAIALHASGLMHTLKELVEGSGASRELESALKTHFHINLENEAFFGIALTFFEHKVPDGWSFPNSLKEGEVTDSEGKLVAFKPFIPAITPPYKADLK